MIRILAALVLALAAPVLARSAPPPPVQATCDTLAAVLTVASPGSTVALAGACGSIAITGRSYASPVTLDLTGATFASLILNDVHGLNLIGGKATGSSPTTGVSFGGSDNFSVDGLACDGKPRCMVIGRSHDFVLSEVAVTNPGIDGIDLDLVQRAIVQRTKCMGFNPLPNAHPDCIQIFDTAGEPHVADIMIRDSVVVGQMQGIGYFDHGRASAMERLTITGNRLMTLMPDGITTNGRCSGCIIADNHADALPGADHYIQINTGSATPAYPGAISNNVGGNVRPTRLAAGASATLAVSAAMALIGPK